MLPALTALSPNHGVIILTIGLALIALELNRPGSIFYGALGLLLSLLAAASLTQHHLHSASVVGFVASMALLLLQVRRSLLWIISAGATILLVLSMGTLLPVATQPGVSPWIALVCGLLLGAGITVLTRIARRARQNKGLD